MTDESKFKVACGKRENEILGAAKEVQKDIEAGADRIDNAEDLSRYLPFREPSASVLFPVLVQIIGQDKSRKILRKLRYEDPDLANCLTVKKNNGEWEERDLLDNGCAFLDRHKESQFDFLRHLESRLNRLRAYTASIILFFLLKSTQCFFSG